MQLPPKSYSSNFSDLLRSYYLAPDHPCKLRLLGWLEALGGKKRISVKTESGFRFAVDRRDYIQNTVFKTRRWENEIEGVLRAELSHCDVLFDIGANAGYFSLFALQLGCKRVISFEPNPELEALFRHNLKLNHISEDKCMLYGLALSDHAGNFIYQEGPITNSGIGHLANDPNAVGMKVKTDTLDNFLDNCGQSFPTAIKLDVEGWEINVLRGAKRLFERSAPRLIVFEADCNAHCEIADEQLLQFFISRGYKINHLPRKVIESKENYVARRL